MLELPHNHDIIGIPVTGFADVNHAVDCISNRIDRTEKSFVIAINPEKVLLGKENTELRSATMGIVSLDAQDEFKAVNEQNRKEYALQLEDIPGILLSRIADQRVHNMQYVITEVDSDSAGLTRDALTVILEAENILARKHSYPGCHRIPPINASATDISDRLKVTEMLCDTVLALPTGTGATTDAIQKTCRILRLAVQHSEKLREALQAANK